MLILPPDRDTKYKNICEKCVSKDFSFTVISQSWMSTEHCDNCGKLRNNIPQRGIFLCTLENKHFCLYIRGGYINESFTSIVEASKKHPHEIQHGFATFPQKFSKIRAGRLADYLSLRIKDTEDTGSNCSSIRRTSLRHTYSHGAGLYFGFRGRSYEVV